MPKKYPEKWLEPFKEMESAELEPNEQLKAFFMFETIDKTTRKAVGEIIFAITTKENKAIGKVIAIGLHPTEEKYAVAGAAVFAEYPENETQALLDESIEAMSHFALGIHLHNEGNQDVDFDKPIFGIQAKNNATNTQMVIDMLKIGNDGFDTQRQIAIGAMGLNKTLNKQDIDEALKELIPQLLAKTTKYPFSMPITGETNEEPIIGFAPEKNKQPSPEETKTALTKAAEEQALIDKYGLKKIQALAEKINYHGEIINKK